MNDPDSMFSTQNQRKYAIVFAVLGFLALIGFFGAFLPKGIDTLVGGPFTIGHLIGFAMLWLAQGLYRNRF